MRRGIRHSLRCCWSRSAFVAALALFLLAIVPVIADQVPR